MASAAEMPLQPDRGEIEAFLTATICTDIHLVRIVPDGPDDNTRGQWFGSDAAKAAEWAVLQNQQGNNVYWTVNLCRPGLNKKPKGGKADPNDMGDMVGHRFAHVDIDAPKDGSQWNATDASQALAELPYPPAFTLFTGGGLGAFWRLDETVTAKATITDINRALAQRLGGDNCHNHDRLMRVPGTVNYPDAGKRSRGRTPRLAYVLEPDDGVVYPLPALAAEFKPISRDNTPPPKAPVPSGSFPLITADDLDLGPLDPLRSLIDHPNGQDRSRDAYACAGAMHRAGCSDEQILGVLMNSANAVSEHIFAQRDPRYQALKCLNGTRAITDVGKAAHGEPPKPLAMIDPATWGGAETPPREWALDQWIPARQATYLTGPGSAGKSLVTQQLCTCIALGIPFMGIETRQAVAIYITCEDDADELHRRQKSICAALGVRLADLSGKLHLVSLMGEIGNELILFDERDRGTPAPRFEET